MTKDDGEQDGAATEHDGPSGAGGEVGADESTDATDATDAGGAGGAGSAGAVDAPDERVEPDEPSGAGDAADDRVESDGTDEPDEPDEDRHGLPEAGDDDHALRSEHGEHYGAVRHGALPHRSAVATLLRVVGVAAVVVLASATSVAAIAAGTLSSAVETVHIGPTGKPAVTGAAALEGAVDFVLVGSDTRQDQAEAVEGDPGTLNNDVTMLVHISADHQQMTAISIPRDTVGPLPACVDSDSGERHPATTGMFNTALARGGTANGLNCVVAAVANLTGVQATFAGIFKFDGVAAMSEAVGGVDVCIAEPIHDRYVGLHLEPGVRTLEGRTASAFLRSRHGVADGSDLGRISNQQVFLSALARKVLAPGGTLSNPVQLYRLAHAALSNMIVSDNLKSADTMVSLALTMQGMDLSKILFVQYPTVEDPADRNRLVVDQAAAHALNVAVQDDAKTTLSASALGRGAVAAPGGQTSGAASSSPAAPATGAPGTGATTGGRRPTAPATPGRSAPAERPTALPSSITGQTASEQTCSKGSG